jgi:hypothetical protein
MLSGVSREHFIPFGNERLQVTPRFADLRFRSCSEEAHPGGSDRFRYSARI